MASKVTESIWIRLSVDFPDHPKVGVLSDHAFRALIEMLTYCRRVGQDGLIPVRLADQRWGTKITDPVTGTITDSVTELLENDPESPSLIREGNFYRLHDYSEWQETREQINARKARNKANGAKGGRPRKNPTKTQSVTESLTESGTQTKPKPKAEIEIEVLTNVSTNTLPRSQPKSRFEEFYAAYPRKAGKADANKSFDKATKTVDPQILIDAAKAYAADPNREQQFTKHPATWLNQGCWDDDPLPARSSNSESQAMKNARSIQQRFHQPQALDEPWLIGGPNGHPERN